ncbi:MAG TPA: 3-keto-5-aminohexanoate cleavage protein [Pyrinomonadaceae bacterium]|nr:3-keto-5-aminohexanoate cleavage protein [Pyrinomonadaceae bacterium]
MLIKAAINGGRSPADHPAVPVSPEEQAAAVVKCLAAGANAIHLHVRGTNSGKVDFGKESLFAADIARTLSAVRETSPRALIGVSTGAWILAGRERLQAISAWEVPPDFASVNFSESGAAELTKLFLSRGVGVEAGLIDSDSAHALVVSGLTSECLRLLLEPQEQEMSAALQTVRAMEDVLSEAGRLPPLLLHGTEATTWDMMSEAISRGYEIRIGLEDTLVLPDGTVAADNVALINEALRRVASA